jgi:membrane protease subunit HflK
MDNNEQSFRPANKPLNFSPKLVIGLIVAVIAISVVMSSFFVVDQTEQAVVTRFGEYNRTVGPGLQTKVPLGIEKSYKVPTQVVQSMTFGYRSTLTSSPLIASTDYPSESIMLTGDLNIIDLEWIVQFKIDQPKQWLFNVNDKETTIRDISQSIMNQLVGDLPILAVMTSERTNIEVQAQELMQAKFDQYELGINVVTIKLQNIVPPAGEVQNAFEDVNKAIQDMEKFINEGKEEYNSIIPRAEGEANQQIQIAEGYAKERVNNAKGDVARFNSMREIYEKSKDVTATRLYIETMEEVLLKNPEKLTVVDKNLDNFLPISQLNFAGSSNAAANTVTGTTTFGGTN